MNSALSLDLLLRRGLWVCQTFTRGSQNPLVVKGENEKQMAEVEGADRSVLLPWVQRGLVCGHWREAQTWAISGMEGSITSSGHR